MIAGIAQFLDSQFIDPAVAAVAGVNPASITNGAATAAATTNPLADIMGLIKHFATNGIAVDGVTFIMSPSNALSLSFRTNLDGSAQFPGVGLNGGSYRGLTFITSGAAGANVIALQPQLILYADDGGVSIDASREASLQMDSAPASPADATTVYVSLWQTNTVGLRAERFVNWKRVGVECGEVPHGHGLAVAVGWRRDVAGNGKAAKASLTPLMAFPALRDLFRRAPAATASPAASAQGGGWFPVVRESYTGAWQQNVEITAPSALANPTVFACVTLIASDIGKVRLRLVEQTNGIWTEAQSPAFSPVLRKPNRAQTIVKFLESWMFSKLIHGNTYVLKQRDERGVVTSLYILDPLRVIPLITPDGAIYYRLSSDHLAGLSDAAADVTVPANEIIHDRFNCLFHQLIGISPLYAAGGPALQGTKIQDSSTQFFANHQRPSGVLTAPGAISQRAGGRLQNPLASGQARAKPPCWAPAWNISRSP